MIEIERGNLGCSWQSHLVYLLVNIPYTVLALLLPLCRWVRVTKIGLELWAINDPWDHRVPRTPTSEGCDQ